MKRILISLSTLVLAIFLCVPIRAQSGGDRFVALDTTKGRIVIRVFYSMVPYTAGRFLELVDSGFYNGLTFHRVESWVIQGGDPNGNGSGVLMDGQGRPRYLNLEINPALNHNQPGMVAMARSANPNSASCQFYITKSAVPQLNRQYAVFGRVVSGAGAVMNMRIGDRIIGATILQSDRPNGDDAEIEAVPGATPDQPAAAQPAPVPAVQESPPSRPKPPPRHSLPGGGRSADADQRPSAAPSVEPQQTQQPAQSQPKETPTKPEESGF